MPSNPRPLEAAPLKLVYAGAGSGALLGRLTRRRPHTKSCNDEETPP